ncbi:hypothetical protein JW796_00750 [Candidatus Dojkabacteria bacterium]|nr:hypothetical protein [Candidatus Dojkabacteria bacterium]
MPRRKKGENGRGNPDKQDNGSYFSRTPNSNGSAESAEASLNAANLNLEEAKVNLINYGIDLENIYTLDLGDNHKALIFKFSGTSIGNLCMSMNPEGEIRRIPLIDTIEKYLEELSERPNEEVVFFTLNVGCIIGNNNGTPGELDIRIIYTPETPTTREIDNYPHIKKSFVTGNYFQNSYKKINPESHYMVCLQVPTILSQNLKPSFKVFSDAYLAYKNYPAERKKTV